MGAVIKAAIGTGGGSSRSDRCATRSESYKSWDAVQDLHWNVVKGAKTATLGRKVRPQISRTIQDGGVNQGTVHP